MINISNQDAATLRRLLGRLQGTAGNDNQTKNIRRQAILLSKKIDKKINNGKAGIKLL
jgi:hypothetical protein